MVIYTPHGFYKSFSQNPDPCLLANYLHRTFPNANFHIVYEAGCFGFWIQHQLQDLGLNCMVIHPGDVPTSDKQKRRKTDRVDVRKLAVELRAVKLESLYIPSEKAIGDRMLVRTRGRMVKQQTRLKNQIKSTLLFLGVEIPFESNQHWSARFVKWLEELDMGDTAATTSLRAYLQMLCQTKLQIASLHPTDSPAGPSGALPAGR